MVLDTLLSNMECSGHSNDHERIVLPSGFEPELKPREGFMIGRYTTGAGKQRIAI